MIFDRHVAWDILEGKVTQFHRPVRSQSPGWSEGELHKLEVTRSVSWLDPERQGEDDDTRQVLLGFIRITDIEQRPLSELTDADAKAAGWSRAERLFDWWRDRYGTGPLDPHARCWTVTFELSRDHIPRLLHRDSQHGYTHDPRLALSEEPEAVDEIAQAKITENAARNYSATHAEDQLRQKARSLSAKLKEAVNRATRKGIDIEPNVDRLQAELDEITRKLRDAA